nr:MAG TPA: hypothetical protein [Caudoviricetes sp.]
MVVVVEALAFAGAFFVCYNISRKVPVTLRGLVRFLFICVIMNIHHRQRATRLSHSSFFIFANIYDK